MINASGIHHLVLKVSDLKKSRDFYIKACGMEVFSESNDAVGLTGCGIDSLWLQLPENGQAVKAFNRKGDIGLDHLAFSVESIKDLKEIKTHLKQEGVEMEDGGITDDGYGGTAIFTFDPDGIPVEFHLVKE